MAAGLLAWLFAWHFEVPPTTFAFPGVVAMVPGSYAFRAVLGCLEVMQTGGSASATLVDDTGSLLISATVLTLAIAVGLAVPLALPMPVKRRVRSA
jgi:uncharacterized membrane protein YjjB (DUF3815 family)